nr:hypothetical protein [Candidatus Levybacteria bacterium]
MEKNIETKDLEQPLIHEFSKETLKSSFTPKIIALLVGVVFLGVISGYFLASNNGSLPAGKIQTSLPNGATVSKGMVVGSNDIKTFKDIAEGVLKEGGIDGEGSFHLVRPGGESQNVYLTSSSVDLSKFIDKKIKVWGQTQKAQSAGWFMDVGRVEVLE